MVQMMVQGDGRLAAVVSRAGCGTKTVAYGRFGCSSRSVTVRWFCFTTADGFEVILTLAVVTYFSIRRTVGSSNFWWCVFPMTGLAAVIAVALIVLMLAGLEVILLVAAVLAVRGIDTLSFG